MIQAQDLRIGNIAYSELTQRNVKINVRLLALMQSEQRVKGKTTYRGIPLTEEILLNCGSKYTGFKKDNYQFEKIKIYDLGNQVTLYYYVDYKNFSIFYKNQVVDCYDGLLDIELHQLQNLYFSLTQKELEIKL